MPINEAALKKLRAAPFTSETFASVLETICDYKDLLGSGDSQMNLDYQVKGVPVKMGEMIPFITFGIRQVEVSEVAEMDDAPEVSVSGVSEVSEMVNRVRAAMEVPE